MVGAKPRFAEAGPGGWWAAKSTQTVGTKCETVLAFPAASLAKLHWRGAWSAKSGWGRWREMETAIHGPERVSRTRRGRPGSIRSQHWHLIFRQPVPGQSTLVLSAVNWRKRRAAAPQLFRAPA